MGHERVIELRGLSRAFRGHLGIGQHLGDVVDGSARHPGLEQPRHPVAGGPLGERTLERLLDRQYPDLFPVRGDHADFARSYRIVATILLSRSDFSVLLALAAFRTASRVHELREAREYSR